MKKRFLSLLLTAALVVGLIPAMTAAPVLAAGGTEYFADNFENYNVGDEFSSTSAATDKSNNVKWTMDASIKAKVVSVTGYDGKTTQAMKVYSEALTNKHKFRLNTSNSLPSGVPYVYEFKIYIPEDIGQNRVCVGNLRYYTALHTPNSDTSDTIKSGTNMLGSWTKVKFVTKADGNALIYIDDELVSYNNSAHKVVSLAFPAYFELRSQTGTPPIEILLDDVNFYHTPTATAATAAQKDATDVALTVKPTVTFNEALLDSTVNSDATVTITDKTNGGTVAVENLTVSADGKTLTIDPATNLVYGTQYEIKLNNFRDVYDAAVTGDTTFTFTTMAEPKYDITAPTFKKLNLFSGDAGTNLTKLENGTISCSYSVTNNDTSDKPVLMLVVLKENDELKSFQFKTVTLASGETADFNGGFAVGDAANTVIECYTWDSLVGMNPLGAMYHIDADGIDSTEE